MVKYGSKDSVIDSKHFHLIAKFCKNKERKRKNMILWVILNKKEFIQLLDFWSKFFPKSLKFQIKKVKDKYLKTLLSDKAKIWHIKFQVFVIGWEDWNYKKSVFQINL